MLHGKSSLTEKMFHLPMSKSIFHIDDFDSETTMNVEKKEIKNSLGNIFNNVGFECKFKLDVVSFGEAVALGINQGFVAC